MQKCLCSFLLTGNIAEKVIVFIELFSSYIRRKDNGRKIIFAQNEQRLRHQNAIGCVFLESSEREEDFNILLEENSSSI